MSKPFIATVVICSAVIGGGVYYLYKAGELTSTQPQPTEQQVKKPIVTVEAVEEVAQLQEDHPEVVVDPVETVAEAALPHGRFPISPEFVHFVDRYCMECHDIDTQKGDRHFEMVLEDPNAPENALIVEEILDQLNLGEMPPMKKNVEQPSDEEKIGMIAELTRYLNTVRQSEVAEASVLRRLTRYEYKYTIRDLLGVDPEASDVTDGFPLDNNIEGFYNVGAAQALSDQQLEQYMKAARHYLDQALFFNESRPRVEKFTFKPKDFGFQTEVTSDVAWRTMHKRGQFIDIGHGTPVERLPTYPRNFTEGVPMRGQYRIAVTATAMDREPRYDPKLVKRDTSVPLKMGLWHVPDAKYLSGSASQGRVFLEAFDLADNTRGDVYEATTWMPEGSIPFVHWMNGYRNTKQLVDAVRKRYHPETDVLTRQEVDYLKAQGKKVPKDAMKPPRKYLSEVYEGPRVRVFDMEIEGPFYDEWPPKSHQMIVGDAISPRMVRIPEMIVRFASRAFRQTVTQAEVQHYIDFIDKKIAYGASREEAIKLGLTAILVSPRFLYMEEGNREEGEYLSQFELANRLSYAFWCSMPSDGLFKLAAAEKLTDPDTLSWALDRFLDDTRSSAFIEHFADSWLRLDKVGSMPPAVRTYREYYDDRLETAMLRETHMFFNHIVRENRPITDFLDANYSFVNGPLARHYGVEGVVGEEFQRVKLPEQSYRYGLLGHASILTATANGIETSPVTRGVWILENILGTPPPPPPPDVPPIEPDVRGAVTIRQQLSRHRDVPACNNCHEKIDPWGFTMENFDPIGGYRSRYKNGNMGVDSTATLPDGTRVHGPDQLSEILVERKRTVAKNLARKLLIYSTGRELTYRDEPELEAIVKETEAKGYGMRDLLHAVVRSEIFRRR
ncbi:MAG: DUF1592 domain-containing protein [Lentimonas sp.]